MTAAQMARGSVGIYIVCFCATTSSSPDPEFRRFRRNLREATPAWRLGAWKLRRFIRCRCVRCPVLAALLTYTGRATREEVAARRLRSFT